MKKLFVLLITVMASVGMLHAASGTCGDNLTWDLTDSVLTISGTGAMNSYSTSARYGLAPWNYLRSSIKSVIISEGVTSIGNSAFYQCNKITSITFPSSVKSIGSLAFYQSDNITSVYISDIAAWCAIKSTDDTSHPISYRITGKLYLNNELVVDLVIPEGVTSIGRVAFGFTSIKSVTIPKSVVSIGSNAFNGCQDLEAVYIKDIAAWCSIDFGSEAANPLYYANDLYLNNELVENVTIPDGITAINNNAFISCHSLKSVTIPNSVTNIGERAFTNCWSLTSVTLSNSVKNIDKRAFLGCSSLKSIDIPDSVTNIGFAAFTNCSSLESVVVGKGVATMEERIFSGCNNLTSVVWNAQNCADFVSGNTPFCYVIVTGSDRYDLRWRINSFTFGEDVEYIPAYLCNGMTNVPEIYVANCQVQVGELALANCNSRIEGAYNIVYPDTVLCYGEDLYVDGMKCDLPMQPNNPQTWTRKLKTVEGCDSTISMSVTWYSLPSYIELSHKDEMDNPNTGSIKIERIVEGEYDYYTLNGKKNASLNNLPAGHYTVAFISELCEDSVVKNVEIKQLGIRVNGKYYLLDKENHTAILTFRGASYSDYSNEYSGDIIIPKTITFDGEEYQVTGINAYTFSGCNNVTSVTIESETPITVPALESAMNYSGLSSSCIIYVPYGSLNAYRNYSLWWQYNLHVINPAHVTTTSSATSVSITFGDSDDQEHIVSCGFEGGETVFAGNIVEYVGLEPNSAYKDIPFFVNTKEGDHEIIKASFSTSALTLTTKESKAVSGTTAILLAETNISDAETNCGFEYKRNDAPDDFTPTKVYCPVASGQMAGRLKNLRDDVYYKYRAFYESTSGKKYYGEWKYIFTGDIAVEFDPILYTYGATVVGEREATINGYALAGSEDFTEQGFEYWAESRIKGQSDNVQGTKEAPLRMPAAYQEDLGKHHFVKAKGITMRVTLTNLDPGTVYKYRVYATVGNDTITGSEMSFSTEGIYYEPSYVITFVNWDGEVLQSAPVETGTMPVYNGAEPVRPEDDDYTYVFSGWSPELVIVTEAATYTAQFIPHEATAIDNVQSDNVQCTKVFRDGQIYIIRGEKVYTVMGQSVK